MIAEHRSSSIPTTPPTTIGVISLTELPPGAGDDIDTVSLELGPGPAASGGEGPEVLSELEGGLPDSTVCVFVAEVSRDVGNEEAILEPVEAREELV